ncbi:MAG: 2-oxoglutarate dehydrogenase, E2 component, dihydrolipoamide succinyltransferase [Acidobacteria bacterium]|nr:2-oxoglutarate dehydrogenase, E2 component, dihydrolipoamide succinyltransferase [Acidobacteriota bacterium]
MPTPVIMPQMGESIVEGTITKWLKQIGDSVEKDEPLFEISTDKVDAEIPSPISGILTEIKFPEGATVGINTVVAMLGENGSAVAQQTNSTSAPAPKAAPAKPQVPLAKPASPAPLEAAKPQVVVMPQMGESIFEGTITKWLKKVGDSVKKDEPLFEISTDKVDAEIPSHVDGILTEIRAQEGETVQINAVVAIIGGFSAERPTFAHAPSTPQKAQTVAPQKNVQPNAAPALQTAAVHAGEKIRSSPLVRRMAKEHNIDLRYVAGSGSSGRINKQDILNYLDKGAAAPQVPEKTQSAPPPVALTADVVPLTKMRAIIAQRMVESKRIAPHVYSIYKVDMTRIVRLRDRERAAFEQRHGVKLTYMPFVATAAIEALRHHPIVNASLVDNAIHYHANINIGIAVALEWGLIVPTVRESEKRSFSDLARIIADLAARARSKKLSPDEVGGSTFTLTNPGIFGDEFGIPIINQPESAILAIGALKKEPVVLTDAEGNDTIAIRSMQYYCLGYDHRLIDGADGGKFMSEIKRQLETWDHPLD